MLSTNMVIDHRYKILDEIGRGGMSIVYRATVERSGKIWAVKEVRKDGRNDYNVVRQNLIAEIETLKEVKHPKLPEIADVIDNDDSFIIVMDYIEGVSLDKIFSRKGAQPEEKVVDWAKQLCEVLGYLHSKNIVYRDMKPSNVMLKKNGEITIIDFGTAKKYEYDSGETTGLGTAGFAAPEQYGGYGRTDARTDIFCLGMTMYALLTGIDPQKNFVPDTSIRKVNPEFTSGLDDIVQKCTRKNPADRYQSCEELLYYLERYKEIDKGSRKRKRLQIGLFVSSFALSLILGVCGVMLNLRAKALATDNYQELLDSAEQLTINPESPDYLQVYQEKLSLYEQAIEVPNKAGEAEAYLGVINTFRENDGSIPVFSQDESNEIVKLLLNHKAVLEENPQNYAEICYELGELYWYYYDAPDKKEAVKYFESVEACAEKAQVDPEKLELAEVYDKLGSISESMNRFIKEGQDENFYLQLLESTEELVDKVGADESKRDILRLKALDSARLSLRQYATDFYRTLKNIKYKDSTLEDPSAEHLQRLYLKIENILQSINVENYDKSHPVYVEKLAIEKEMPGTLEIIEEACQNQEKATDKGSYQNLLNEAEQLTIDPKSSDYLKIYQEKLSLYKQAMEVTNKAGEAKAYLGIINTFKENDSNIPVFSQDEQEEIDKLLTDNQIALEENPEDYAEICYEIGELCWYYYDSPNENARRKEAVKYFEHVTENAGSYANKENVELAETYSEIYSATMDIEKDGDTEEVCLTLFKGIEDLVDKVSANGDKEEILRLRSLEDACDILKDYAKNFRNALDKHYRTSTKDYSANRLQQLYQKIEDTLKSINVENYEKTHPIHAEKSAIEEKISKTKKAVEAACQNAGE